MRPIRVRIGRPCSQCRRRASARYSATIRARTLGRDQLDRDGEWAAAVGLGDRGAGDGCVAELCGHAGERSGCEQEEDAGDRDGGNESPSDGA